MGRGPPISYVTGLQNDILYSVAEQNSEQTNGCEQTNFPNPIQHIYRQHTISIRSAHEVWMPFLSMREAGIPRILRKKDHKSTGFNENTRLVHRSRKSPEIGVSKKFDDRCRLKGNLLKEEIFLNKLRKDI